MVGQYQPCCKRMMSVEYLDWDIEGRGVSGGSSAQFENKNDNMSNAAEISYHFV